MFSKKKIDKKCKKRFKKSHKKWQNENAKKLSNNKKLE